MLVTLHRMDELNRVIEVNFYNSKDTTGQLFTHTYSYMYMRRSYEKELGYTMVLGTPSDNYKTLDDKVDARIEEMKIT